MPAPLAIPPTVQPSRVAAAVFGTVSVVRIAVAAASPPAPDSAAAALSTPGSSASIGSRSPIRPVEQTATSIAPMPSAAATASAVACVSAKPALPVHALAPPALSTTAVSRPVVSTCWVHSTGAAFTRLLVKHAGRRVERAVVDDQREIGAAAGPDAGGDPGGPEAPGGGDAHGATPSALRPAVSGRPRTRLAHCTAWPAAPLPRLSIALQTTTRPESASTVACRWALLLPSGRGGVRPAAVGQQVDERLRRRTPPRGRHRTASASTPGRAGRAVTVARMPRGIGARTGVKDSVRAPVACRISGTCW